VKEVKQTESGSLISSAQAVFELRLTAQALSESEAMTTESESWNGCRCSLAHCLGEVLNSPLEVRAVSDAMFNNDQLV